MSDHDASQDFNPYHAPEFSSSAPAGESGGDAFGRTAAMLRQTKPWVRFVSVLLFIGAAFLVIVGLVVLAGAGGLPLPPMVGLVYIVMAFLYLAPGVFLWQYATRIGDFLLNRSVHRLDKALESQKSFWRYVGIVALVVLLLYFVIFIVAIIGSIIGMRP